MATNSPAEAATQSTTDRVGVFWQPCCTRSPRTKEFLTRRGVDYESINVHGNGAAMAELAELGARSVRVIPPR